MARLISKRYAIALFELAKETNKIDEFNTEVQGIYESIKYNKEFLEVLNHPRISSEEKFTIFKNIFQDKISEEVLGLIYVITNKNREHELLEILEIFLNLVKEFKGITTAYVYSAIKLTDEQLKAINEKLNEKLSKQVIIEAYEKPELIGGILINVDGKVIDNSIKKGLEDIKKSLINN